MESVNKKGKQRSSFTFLHAFSRDSLRYKNRKNLEIYFRQTQESTLLSKVSISSEAATSFLKLFLKLCQLYYIRIYIYIYSIGGNILTVLAFHVADIFVGSHTLLLWGIYTWRKNDIKISNRSCCTRYGTWMKDGSKFMFSRKWE